MLANFGQLTFDANQLAVFLPGGAPPAAGGDPMTQSADRHAGREGHQKDQIRRQRLFHRQRRQGQSHRRAVGERKHHHRNGDHERKDPERDLHAVTEWRRPIESTSCLDGIGLTAFPHPAARRAAPRDVGAHAKPRNDLPSPKRSSGFARAGATRCGNAAFGGVYWLFVCVATLGRCAASPVVPRLLEKPICPIKPFPSRQDVL